MRRGRPLSRDPRLGSGRRSPFRHRRGLRFDRVRELRMHVRRPALEAVALGRGGAVRLDEDLVDDASGSKRRHDLHAPNRRKERLLELVVRRDAHALVQEADVDHPIHVDDPSARRRHVLPRALTCGRGRRRTIGQTAEYPRRSRGAAASPRNVHVMAASSPRRLHGISTSRPRWRRDRLTDYPRRLRGGPKTCHGSRKVSPRGAGTVGAQRQRQVARRL